MQDILTSIPFQFEMNVDSLEPIDPGNIKQEGKSYYLSGIASDNLPDKQNQRFSKNFLKTMVDSAEGMTCFFEHKRDLDHSIGFCKEATIIEDSLHVRIKMEDPEENDLVKKIITKNDHGVKIGLSISGVVTKHSIEKSESGDNIKTNEDEDGVQVLEEGRLDEISAVGLPCNPRGWATVIFKSVEKSMEVNDMSDEKTQETTVEEKDIEQVEENQPIQKNVDEIIAQLQAEVEVLKAKVPPLDEEEDEEEEEEPEAEKAVEEVPPTEEAPQEAASTEDVMMISQEIVAGIGQAINTSMEQLGGVLDQLRTAFEGQAVEAEKSMTRIKEKLEYMEKSHYDRIEQMVRSEGDRVESALKNSDEKKSEKLTEEIKKSSETVEKLIDTDEFKQAIQGSVEESIRNLQKNPSPVRKSQGNKEFNNPENHVEQEVDEKIDSGQVNPFSVSKSDMKKLNREERMDILNRGLSAMTGFSQ